MYQYLCTNGNSYRSDVISLKQGSHDLDNRSESAEKLPVFDMESSDNSSTTYGDKVGASGMALDASGRAKANKVIEANSNTETGKEATTTEEETNEFLDLHISQKKSKEDEIRAVSVRSDGETTADDSTKLSYEDHPNETDIRTTSYKEFKVTGVRSLAESDRNENSLSYTDHQKSNEDNSKTAVLDSITENDNRKLTKETEEHHLSHGGSKRSNKDDITTFSGTVLNQTTDGEYDTKQVEDSTTEHHLSYRHHDNKPKIRSFYERSMTKEEKSPVKDEISQHPTYRVHRTSAETEIRTDTETVNKSRASEETTDIRVHSIPGGFHEVSGRYETLSSARTIPSHITSADSEIKEIAGNSENNWKAKISYTDASTTGEDQIPQIVDCSPQNVDYRRYSRDYDISSRRALFEQKDKSVIAEKRISVSPSHLARRSQSSSSESEVFTPQASSFFNATSVNLASAPDEASKKNDLDELSLPSVKLLRLKFSTPSDTSSAEASLLRVCISLSY